MSWRRRDILALIGVSLLGGCGFEPLYGHRAQSNSAPAQFSQIALGPIDGRAGHHLRNYLIDRFSARGGTRKKTYRLEIALTERKDGLAIRQDESVTRFNYRLLGGIRLIRIQDQAILYETSLRVTSAFNVVDSEFATLSAERDAEERAARELSDEVVTRLALYFQRSAEQPPAKGPA